MRKALGDVLKKVLMVPPHHFTVDYVINPWMGGTVDGMKATQQWNALRDAILKEGIEVKTLDQVAGFPDMVFVCNSGLAYRNGLYLSKFRHAERNGEQSFYAKWFSKQGYQMFGTDYPEVFEGGGDAVFSDTETLWAGWGHRTSKEAYRHIAKMGDFEVVLCELVKPLFYHLDTCFCPVGIDSALWYPPAFSKGTQSMIQKRLPGAIAVSENEARAFVCNAIVLRRTKIGFDTVELEMSEFMKAGGACQCLVMKL